MFVTDLVSLKFIENSLIDWKEDLSSAQFVIENPQAKAKCGCGTSFNMNKVKIASWNVNSIRARIDLL